MIKHPPTIETDRLILRPFEIEDAERVRTLAGAKEIYETTLLIPHPYEKGMAEKWISTHLQNFYHNKGLNFAIVDKKENVLIGAIGLIYDAKHHHAEMGYWIGIPYWGKGYCTEAAKVVLDYGFSELSYHRIFAHHMAGNPSSGRVMEKIGMKREGEFKEHVYKDGVFHSCIFYGITNLSYKENIPH